MVNDKLNNIEIKSLQLSDATALSALLRNSSSVYSQHFTPFAFNQKSIDGVLGKAVHDKYYGVFVNRILVGFYMLRGFDEGFSVPAYGVWISEDFANKGLSSLTLQHAISFCKLNSITRLMLKVHPDNLIAKHIYEKFGFDQTGVDSKNQHLIFHKNI